ncbi:MAG: LytTR family DNA-binding domain-containing protein [Saprospiraceae bacterium]|nr:LytTR family DNA-binding domain-containing protein [Saprospiraceae bacterium]
MRPLNAIIIDDAPDAIENLKMDLNSFCPNVEVVATASGVVEGAKVLRTQNELDILFLDIQLQDGTGFDLLEIFPQLKAKVIFTTASDAFAVDAFRVAAVDYLLKPIDPELLQQAVEKVRNQLQDQQATYALLKETMDKGELTGKIALHTLEKIHIVEIDQIVRCESSGNYTQFFFGNGQKLLVTKTLKEFDKMLSPHGFIRVHQSHLVNLDWIEAFLKQDGGYLLMKDGAQVVVSTRRRAPLLRLLG